MKTHSSNCKWESKHRSNQFLLKCLKIMMQIFMVINDMAGLKASRKRICVLNLCPLCDSTSTSPLPCNIITSSISKTPLPTITFVMLALSCPKWNIYPHQELWKFHHIYQLAFCGNSTQFPFLVPKFVKIETFEWAHLNIPRFLSSTNPFKTQKPKSSIKYWPAIK